MSRVFFVLLVCPALVCHFSASSAMGQSDKGETDLEQAFQKKIEAQSTKDLDAVVKLCESAIKKGLDEEGTERANQLAGSALMEHSEKLSEKIFSRVQDPRWQVYRTQALNRLKKAVKFVPEMGEAYLLIAKLNAIPGGNLKDAREAVEKAVELAGDDREQLSTALFYRASMAEEDEARLADLGQAIKINPKNVEAIRVRALYYLQKNDPESALKDLNAWLKSDKKNFANHIFVAQQLMRVMELGGTDDTLAKEALRILDDASKLKEKNGLPYSMSARINEDLGNLEEALKNVSKAIELNEKDFSSLALRGRIQLLNEDLDAAMEDVTKALELQPNLTEGIQVRALINMQKMEFGKAIPDIRLLSNSNPSNSGLKRQLAMLYNADDQPKRAIAIYDALLKLDAPGSWDGESPEFQIAKMSRRAENLHGRGDSQLSVGGHQEAVDNYTEAMELGKAIRELEASEGVEDPSLPDDGVLNNLAWVLATSTDEKVRDGERSIKLATMAAEQTEFKQAHIISTLASGYAENGDWDNATKWIEKAIEVNEAGEEGVDEARQKEQRESLQKEFDSYQNKKAWRENQAEEAKAAKDKSADKPVEKQVDEKLADEPDKKKDDDKEDDDKEDDSDDKESDDKKKDDKKKDDDKQEEDK